ncbi:hypothetical protein [Limimaricola soesokkakensis]|uniref:hypothetical protein n=1 Tax=Limimaricola soesokkakensis TaxID=1343159 RepID=UPI003559C770
MFHTTSIAPCSGIVRTFQWSQPIYACPDISLRRIGTFWRDISYFCTAAPEHSADECSGAAVRLAEDRRRVGISAIAMCGMDAFMPGEAA